MKKALLFLLLAFALVACGEKKSGGDEPTIYTDTYNAEKDGVKETVTVTYNRAENNRIEKIHIVAVQPKSPEGPAVDSKIEPNVLFATEPETETGYADFVFTYTGTEATKMVLTVTSPDSATETEEITDVEEIKAVIEAVKNKQFIDFEEIIEHIVEREYDASKGDVRQKVVVTINKEFSDRIDKIVVTQTKPAEDTELLTFEVTYTDTKATKIKKTTQKGSAAPRSIIIDNESVINKILNAAQNNEFIEE